ncbi:MAG: PAS domain-containing protein [Deltaproteobacteria bacterium]|nr:PAS domain-containing protein [Deltaproteobacteria bacterium]
MRPIEKNREGNLLYENIIESLFEGVLCVSPFMEVTVFNQSAEKMTELSRGQALGKGLDAVFSRDRWLVDAVRMTLDEGKLFSDCEGRLHRRFSPPFPVGISTVGVSGPDGKSCGVACLIKDLSGIKSIESEALRKERLALIGTFAANLAHEVKNPLGGIKGAAQLLSRKLKDKDAREYAEVIIREADRLNDTVREMLDFAGAMRLKKRNLNIHRVLDRVILLLEGAGGPGVAKAYDPSLPMINGDENRLTQVFMNLIKNAREAVEKGRGEVRVTTRMVTEFHLKEKGSREAKFAEIEIMDTGRGIPEENMERIFTPFFTTKRGGSGLGLSISYGIVREHAGFMKIDSVPGEKTRVRVLLPVEAL